MHEEILDDNDVYNEINKYLQPTEPINSKDEEPQQAEVRSKPVENQEIAD